MEADTTEIIGGAANRNRLRAADGGLIPKETFTLKDASHKGPKAQFDVFQGILEPRNLAFPLPYLCLTYEGSAGTSPNGRGTAVLSPCNGGERQRWHGANRRDKGE
eukprot:Skav218920  [mRNA]  locus=scaffold2606:96166:102719:- [translate_table: standard]